MLLVNLRARDVANPHIAFGTHFEVVTMDDSNFNGQLY